MSKDEIKNRFKETKLGKKINKRFKKNINYIFGIALINAYKFNIISTKYK